MGIRSYLNNARSLYGENQNIIVITIFGFLFFLCGLYLLRTTSIPGGLLFCGSGLFALGVGWYYLKNKWTPAYVTTISFRWEDLPAWKRWAVYAVIVFFVVVCLWLIIETITNSTGSLCLGNCEGY